MAATAKEGGITTHQLRDWMRIHHPDVLAKAARPTKSSKLGGRHQPTEAVAAKFQSGVDWAIANDVRSERGSTAGRLNKAAIVKYLAVNVHMFSRWMTENHPGL